MTKTVASHRKNVEDIRRKNLEDNQLFLKKLLMPEIRDDFLHSARLISRKSESMKKPIEQIKVEYSTRYSEKLKSGEIAPHVPEWQRKIERKKYQKEQEQKRKEMRRQAKEIERQERQRMMEMETEEKLFEEELKKVENILKFEEAIKIRRAEREKLYGPSKWTQFYNNSKERSSNLRRTKSND